MTMDASLAHPETAPENSLLHRLYGGRHLLSRPEQQKPCAICLYAPLIDGSVVGVWLTQGEGAFDMGAVAAVFWHDLLLALG